MANIGKWNAPAISTLLSTELNSLATNTMTAASAAYDNSTNLNLYADIEVNLASVSPTTGARVDIYVLCAEDGTNYPAQSDADLRLTGTQLLVSIPIGTTGATAQRVTARMVPVPPSLLKIKADNQTGATLNASGNTVKFNFYNVNLNG